MVSVGIKELKSHLSSYIDLVEKGEELLVTERGRAVAVVVPISPERRALNLLAKEGKVSWSGGKPLGFIGAKIAGKPLSDTVIEDRR